MKALVMIDVQKGMWSHPDHPPYDGDGVVDRIATLIARARAAGAPVMYVQHHVSTNRNIRSSQVFPVIRSTTRSRRNRATMLR